MNIHQESPESEKRPREFTLQAQINLGAAGEALAKRQSELIELLRLAQGEDPPDNDD